MRYKRCNQRSMVGIDCNHCKLTSTYHLNHCNQCESRWTRALSVSNNMWWFHSFINYFSLLIRIQSLGLVFFCSEQICHNNVFFFDNIILCPINSKKNFNRILTVAIFGRIPNHSQVDLGWSVNELYPQAETSLCLFHLKYEASICYQVCMIGVFKTCSFHLSPF